MATSTDASTDGQVVVCHKLEEWTDEIQKGNDNKRLIVVDFTASWCPPCRIIAPFFADLAKKFPAASFLKVDVDELKDVASDWGVEAMPTFVFIKEGKKVHHIVGAKKEELQESVAKYITSATNTA